MTLCSVIIPARNEVLLAPTVEHILTALRGDSEIIAVVDGYDPGPLPTDARLKIIRHDKPMGQRQSVNEAAREARGQYLLKTDAHSMLSDGFDVELPKDCEYDWTVIPRMYNLDAFHWKCECDAVRPQGDRPVECTCGNPRWQMIHVFEPKWRKVTDAMFIDSDLRARYFDGPTKRQYKWHDHYGRRMRGDICDVMTGQGACFFMYKDRFWELGGMDESHGSWGQMGVEVACKAWLSGGRQVVNKKVWFSHLFRSTGFQFPYPIRQSEMEAARSYSRDLWINGKWPLAQKPFSWLLTKFAPVPGWGGMATVPAVAGTSITVPQSPVVADGAKQMDDTTLKEQFHIKFAHYSRRHCTTVYPTWRDRLLIKWPTDLIQYAELIFKNKPDLIVETGTRFGGSALFFADMCELVGRGRIISVDIVSLPNLPKHPRITYITGRSTSSEVLTQLAEMIRGQTVMVSLDSDHSRTHVKRELHYYGRFVTPGQYMVVEDSDYTMITEKHKEGPLQAIEWFLPRHKEFIAEPLDDRFWLSHNTKGWLRRV